MILSELHEECENWKLSSLQPSSQHFGSHHLYAPALDINASWHLFSWHQPWVIGSRCHGNHFMSYTSGRNYLHFSAFILTYCSQIDPMLSFVLELAGNCSFSNNLCLEQFWNYSIPTRRIGILLIVQVLPLILFTLVVVNVFYVFSIFFFLIFIWAMFRKVFFFDYFGWHQSSLLG